MEFSKSEYWSGEPFLSPGDLPNSGIESRSPVLQTESLPTELSGKSIYFLLQVWGIYSYNFFIFDITFFTFLIPYLLSCTSVTYNANIGMLNLILAIP